jgi:hypothetical protein
MSLPQIFRSESIFHPNGDPRNDHDDNQSSSFNFNENYRIEEEAASAEAEEAESAEAAALEKHKLFILNKQDEYDDYTQVIQITVEAIKSTWTHSGFAVINIHKSEKANEYYIYMPNTGNIYTIAIVPAFTFQRILDYIMFYSSEFYDIRKNNVVLEFVLDSAFQKPNKEMQITTEDFLRLPLGEVPLSQASLKILK